MAQVVGQGVLSRLDGSCLAYEVRHGRDIHASLACDLLWNQANMELFEHIQAQNLSDDELEDVLQSIQAEDAHWCWALKSLQYSGDEYEWFYLHAGARPQAACLIYHPKESALCPGNIFYVEYIAVAPWNRGCKIREREFLKVGSTLLLSVLAFAIGKGLTPGFSLHSLPQAQGYYQKLGMVNIPHLNKDSMQYLELPEDTARKFAGIQ